MNSAVNKQPLLDVYRASFIRPIKLTQNFWLYWVLFFFIVSYALDGRADEYSYWQTIGSPYGDGVYYASESSACTDIATRFIEYDPHAASMDAGSLYWTVQPTLTERMCVATFRNSSGGVHPYLNYDFARIYKQVVYCAAGQQYNYQTKQCVTPGPCQSTLSAPCGPPPPMACAGNPINIASGNKFQTEVDYQASGASALQFSRAYNSLDGLWRHGHSAHVRINDTDVAVVMADGHESSFTVIGSTVTTPPTERGQLIKLVDGWRYLAEDNERFIFDAAGRLTRRVSRSGEQQQLTYANGVVTVIDHLGRSLSFTEDAQHQPLSLTTDGLQITYGYSVAKRLIQLTRTRDGQTEQRQFHYEDPRNTALLTGITDERRVRYATWSYDDQGRATSSEHTGGAEHTQVAYNADGSATVTNELGKNTVYRFVTVDGIKRVSAIEGEASTSCPMSNSTFTYDERGLLKSKTDNKGFVTTYAYNARGLEESRTEAAGTPEARTVTTEWHPTLNLRATVSEPARITTYHYDAQGRPTGQTVTER